MNFVQFLSRSSQILGSLAVIFPQSVLKMIKLPEVLKKKIQKEILKNSKKGENGWRFSKNDEDSLLGDFLGNLRTDKRIFHRFDKEYEWEILYHKMRGRGKNAYESKVGADAIITFEIIDKISNNKTLKSLIFQAKKEGNNSGLKEQKYKMDFIAHGGNFIFTCSELGYYAQTEIEGKKMNIGKFLANEFIECNIGIENFEYDEINRVLKNNGILIEGVELDELLVKVEIQKDYS